MSATSSLPRILQRHELQFPKTQAVAPSTSACFLPCPQQVFLRNWLARPLWVLFCDTGVKFAHALSQQTCSLWQAMPWEGDLQGFLFHVPLGTILRVDQGMKEIPVLGNIWLCLAEDALASLSSPRAARHWQEMQPCRLRGVLGG